MSAYHFIGIGGIGMSGLATILRKKGFRVTGSDIEKNYLVDKLKQEGIEIYIGHEEKHLAQATHVVFSSSVNKNNVELKKAIEKKMTVWHRADLLRFLMQGYKRLLVTGTHGKTTTSSLLTWVLLCAKMSPSYAIGGILKKEKTNACLGTGKYFVAEADESDGSFLKFNPDAAIVTGLEEDHMDYWCTKERLVKGVKNFCRKIKHRQWLFWCNDDSRLKKMNLSGISYGFSSDSDVVITHQYQNNFTNSFSLFFDQTCFVNIQIPLIGTYNVLNATAVFALAIKLKIPEKIIRQAFQSFPGVKRRMECVKKEKKILFYDDYAHHPTAIQKTLEAFRQGVKEKRLIVFFQPHRYSRVKNLLTEFAHSFSSADLVIVTDIYSAGEKQDDGHLIKKLTQQIQSKSKVSAIYLPRNQIIEKIAQYLQPHDAVISMGAGDSYLIIRKVAQKYCKKPKKISLALLVGGQSSEHDISILSAQYLLSHLSSSIYDIKIFGITKQGRWIVGQNVLQRLVEKKGQNDKTIDQVIKEIMSCDVCFPILHGTNGEDGSMQGFLKILQIPYVGCDHSSSALCMNKAWSKIVVANKGIVGAPFVHFVLNEWRKKEERILERIKTICFPVYVKPVHLGSSVGIEYVRDRKQIKKAIEKVLEHDYHIMIEEEILGQQIEFSVKGNDYVDVSIGGEIVSNNEFYDYERKYFNNVMETRVPANISKEKMKEGKKLSKTIYRLLGCTGWARVDFFLRQDGKYFFNEINPIPGCTPHSLYPKMWEKSHIKMDKVFDELVIAALHRSRILKKVHL